MSFGFERSKVECLSDPKASFWNQIDGEADASICYRHPMAASFPILQVVIQEEFGFRFVGSWDSVELAALELRSSLTEAYSKCNTV